MESKKTVENQMSLLLNNPKPWIFVSAPLMITFATFVIFGSLSIIFTSIVVILSSSTLLMFIFSKRKQKLVEKSVDKDFPNPLEPKQQHGSEILAQQKQKDVVGSCQSIHDQHEYLIRSPDVLSENECLDQLSTTEDSEVDWSYRDNMDRTPDYSDDGSISDEDSLIEISLPGGHYVGHKLEVEEQPKFSMQQKLPDFLPETFFQQRSALMELLAELNEMNEEENLIEIDISMGSIKCSRFEIEA